MEMSTGRSELSEAIGKQDIDTVEILLTSGLCSPDGVNADGDPPIVECVLYGGLPYPKGDEKRCEILKILVQHGADINGRANSRDFTFSYIETKGMTALSLAAARGFITCLRFLHASGADLTLETPEGQTALTAAVMEGRTKCVEYLVQQLPLSFLSHAHGNGIIALMRAVHPFRLLSLDRDAREKNCHSAVMLVLLGMNCRVLKLLLDNGALINTLNAEGHSPLSHEIAYYNHIGSAYCRERLNKVILWLLSHGADPTISRLHLDLVHIMVAWGNKPLVRGLVCSGCPPLDIKSANMQLHRTPSVYVNSQKHLSPLAVALAWKRSDIARYFIANRFFTQRDLVRLGWDKDLWTCLSGQDSEHSEGDRGGHSAVDHHKSRVIEIVEFLAATPQSLLNLCLVAVRSALTCHLVYEESDQGYNMARCFSTVVKPTSKDRHSRIARPTLREKVQGLGLPPIFERELLTQTACARICCPTWGEIPLDSGINKQNGNTVSYLIEYSQLLKTWDSVDVDSGDHDPYF
ncbi:hypothetical protein RRG08_055005 [Elysia crispata]|uniref:Ankyrin repeat protein n=1 Tax=Elysia crispata TaxID=231223 RepID=A0AAE0XRW2_9GAST|nr:hypothetical protein RRG08_055005 [Elysia crispata]